MAPGDTSPPRSFEPADLVGDLFADRFRVLRVVTTGANTAVYDARDDESGRTVTLKYRPSTRTRDFRLVTRSRSLAAPTDDGATISRAAMELWDAEPPGIALRLVGVQVSGLDKDRPVQIGLFEAPEDERQSALNAALDDIVARFGPGAVRRGRS